MKTVVEKLFENADRHPDKLAVVFENEEVTYGQLKDAVIRLASWFKLHGIKPGDRVIAQANYSKWFIAAYYAAHLCGAIIVPVEKSLTQQTLQSTVERMGAKASVTQKMTSGAALSLHYDELDALTAAAEVLPWEFPELDSVATIMLTSGTTGKPKGAMRTQKNIAVTCQVQLYEFGIHQDTVGITMSPLNHVSSQNVWDKNTYNGNTYIFLDGFIKISKFFAFIEKYKVTTFNMPPSGVSILESLTKDKLRQYADQIEYVHIQSAPIQRHQLEFLRRMLPHSKLFFAYGSSENGTMTLQRLDKEINDLRCLGLPCKGVEIRILDGGMNALPCGQEGRVAVRSEMNCKGYWAMPELTASVYHGDWFLTNDAGYLDEDGCLYILGRVDDALNIGGLKVYPSEIEDAAMELDAVEECLCFGVTNEVTGNSAKLLIRFREGADMNVRDVRSALAARLDPYKIPAVIEVVPEIRKNQNGKPDRNYYRSCK